MKATEINFRNPLNSYEATREYPENTEFLTLGELRGSVLAEVVMLRTSPHAYNEFTRKEAAEWLVTEIMAEEVELLEVLAEDTVLATFELKGNTLYIN